MREKLGFRTVAVVCALSVVASCGDGRVSGASSGGVGGMSSGTGGSVDAGVGGTTTAGGGNAGAVASGGTGGANDGGDPDGAPCVPGFELPPVETPPTKLSQTGLYADIATKTLAPYVRSFQPQFVLWSDSAQKERYVYLPDCASIDTSDMDHWNMPVGTRFWKQFARDGIVVETRLIHRFGPGAQDWTFAAYQWDASMSDATLVLGGVQNANGTLHDIPSQAQCKTCHGGLPEKILGFGAIQLSHSLGGETIATLSAAGRLTVPNATGFVVPGATQAERAALGYLHANCGNCHNATGLFPDMRLRLLVGATSVEATDTYTTAVNQPTIGFFCPGTSTGSCDRIEPGNAAASAVIMRMSVRESGVQMPPIGSEVVDDAGVALVSAWIDGL